MKTLEWQQFFEGQRAWHGKRVFTVTELANAAGASLQVMNVELSRLIERGMLARLAQGRYGPVEGVLPEELLPFLDEAAYITGFYALHRHNLVTQVPSEITCFTKRRHNRSRERQSPMGRFVFVCVTSRIYARPGKGLITPREQALCDFVYLACRKSLRAESLVTFRNLDRLSTRTLNHVLARYPESVAEAVRRITSG